METIDKLIFALDGDLAALRTKFSEAEKLAQTTGGKIGDNVSAGFKKASESAQKFHDDMAKGLGKTTEAIKLQRYQIINLGQQFQDLGVSLYSGQKPLTVLVQQIPQAVSAVGGLRNALALLAPFGVPIGIAAVAAGFTAAAIAAESSMARIRQAIAITGNASGGSLDQIAALAGGVSANGNTSMSDARSILAQLTGAGVPLNQMGRAGSAVSNYAFASGQDSAEVAQMVKKMFDDPSKSAQELNAQIRLLTAAQTRQVEDLQKQGRYQEAASIVLNEFAARSKEAAGEASFLGRMAHGAGVALGNLWSGMGTMFNGLTRAQRISNLKEMIANPVGATDSVDDMRKELAKLEASQRADAIRDNERGKRVRRQQVIEAGTSVAQQFDPRFPANRAQQQRDLLNNRLVAAQQEVTDVQGRLAKDPNNKQLQGELASARSIVAETRRAIPAVKPLGGQTSLWERQATNMKAALAQASGAEDIAKAYRVSNAEGEKAKTLAEAHTAYIKKDIANEKEYAGALLRRADAQRDMNSAIADRRAQNTVDEAKLELSLFHKAAMERDVEIGKLRIRNDLLSEGYEIGTKAFDSELARREKINQALAQTNEEMRKLERHDAILADLGQIGGNAFETMIRKGATFGDVLEGLEADLANLIIKLGVINPLMNRLSGGKSQLPGFGDLFGGGGGGGDFLGDIFGSLFGGGGGSSKALPFEFAKGGAWSSGVRYAAQGGVLGGPTGFMTGGGPIIGGEKGINTEALMPLAWGPKGLGIRSYGGHSAGSQPNITIVQNISVSPDVSQIARAEIAKQMPAIQASAFQGTRQAIMRGAKV